MWRASHRGCEDRCFRDCKKSSSLSVVLFLSSCFEQFCVTDNICTFSLNVGAPRWRLATQRCSTDWLGKVPVNLRNWIWFVLQCVECRKKVCLDLNKTFWTWSHLLQKIYSSSSWTTLWTHKHRIEEKLSHWDLPSFLRPCPPSSSLLCLSLSFDIWKL